MLPRESVMKASLAPLYRPGALLGWALAAAACTAESMPPIEVVSTEPEYYRDVKPILEARCVSCHQEGGLAPFALDDPELAKVYAPMIVEDIEARRMPPWLASNQCRSYLGDRSLSDAQISTIRDWALGGMPGGDAAREGAPQPFDDNGIRGVDLTLEVPEPFTQRTDPDDYRCFLIPWPYDTVKYVTGFNAVPGTPEVVHHVVSFVIPPSKAELFLGFDEADDGPGYTCFGGPGGSGDFLSAFSVQWLSAWAPGTQGSRFPPGTGIPVEPGSYIALQVHYNSLTAGRLPDKSSVQVTIADSVDRTARVVPFTSPEWTRLKPDGSGFDTGMLIPAGAKHVVHSITADFSFLFTLGDHFEIYGAALHMHEFGIAGHIKKHSPDGGEDCLLDIDRWDFAWQSAYWFTEPVVHRPGDKLELTCEFDNTAEHQPVYGGVKKQPKDIVWGDTTDDEMCVGVLYIVEPASRGN